MRFTRIKGGFSENRRIPRLGRIRLGLKVQKKRQDGSIVEYPTETNYFVTPPEVQEVYGAQPTELDIMLPSDNPDDIFPQSLAWFGRSKGLKCRGNGEEAERLNEQTGEWAPHPCKCEHYKTKENPKGECTEQGNLIMILPKVNVGGTYQLRTGSYNSVVDINSGLDYVRGLIGRISMVPLKLRRIARETHNDGKKQTHYCLSLTLDADIAGLNALRGDTARVLQSARLEIEGPVEENYRLDPPDVVVGEDGAEPEEAETVVVPEGQQTLLQPDKPKPAAQQKPPAKPASKAPQLPPYGAHARKPIDDLSITIEELGKYARSVEMETKDPAKGSVVASNQALHKAILAEIVRRGGQGQNSSTPGRVAAGADVVSAPVPAPAHVSNGAHEQSATDTEITTLVDILMQTRDGNDAYWGIRKNFNLAMYKVPEAEDKKHFFLESLREAVDTLNKANT